MLAVAVLFVVGVVLRKRQPRSKEEDKQWWIEFFGLFIVFALFFVAWGFGLPAAHSLNLGITRLVFQVVFILAHIVLGVIMLVVFCILSPKIREAWKNLIHCLMPGNSKNFDIGRGEHADVEGNIYMTDRSTPKAKMESGDELTEGVSFTFTGNTYENPLAMQEFEDSKLSAGTGPKGGVEDGKEGKAEGDDDSVIKLDLAAHPEGDEELTKL